MSKFSCCCGIDLAKNHFSIRAGNERGKAILDKSVMQSKLLTNITNMSPMTIAIEACGGAYYLTDTKQAQYQPAA